MSSLKSKKYNLVVVAAGKGTRLHQIHNNLYPKLLVNLGQSTLIERLIDEIDCSVDLESITIIVDSQKTIQQIRQAYLDVTNSPVIQEVPVNFIVEPEVIGTAKTLSKFSNLELLPKSNVIISWSDIVAIDFKPPQSETVIYLDSVNRHRLDFSWIDQQIRTTVDVEGQPNGNIPGLFFFEDFKTFATLMKKYLDAYAEEPTDVVDLTEYLQWLLAETDFELDHQFLYNVVDTGDLQKYQVALQNVNIDTRYFNDIMFTDTTVIKSAKTEYGSHVMANESNFYSEINRIPEHDALPFSKIETANPGQIIMGRINGKTVHEKICEADEKNRFKVIKQYYEMFKETISRIHFNDYIVHEARTPADIQAIRTAVMNEYYHVPMERLQKISSILPEINSVNTENIQFDQFLGNLNMTVSTYISELTTKLVYPFRLIHGDPNTSNTMIDDQDRMVFIDPRGQFGGMKLFGDVLYDYAKFLYGLTGYDEFNRTKDLQFVTELYNDQSIDIYLTGVTPKSIIYQLDQLTNNRMVKFLVGLIWLKLPYYTINNINKAIASYAIGLTLVQHYSIKQY